MIFVGKPTVVGSRGRIGDAYAQSPSREPVSAGEHDPEWQMSSLVLSRALNGCPTASTGLPSLLSMQHKAISLDRMNLYGARGTL